MTGDQWLVLVTGDQWPGFPDFNWVTSEESAVPLLDVQAATGLAHFTGLQSVTITITSTITDFNVADPVMPYVDPPLSLSLSLFQSLSLSLSLSPCVLHIGVGGWCWWVVVVGGGGS